MINVNNTSNRFYDFLNLENEVKNRSKSVLSVCKNALQNAQTFAGYVLPKSVMYYSNEQIKQDRASQLSLPILQKAWLGITELKQFPISLLFHAFIFHPLLNKVLDTLPFSNKANNASFCVCEIRYQSSWNHQPIYRRNPLSRNLTK